MDLGNSGLHWAMHKDHDERTKLHHKAFSSGEEAQLPSDHTTDLPGYSLPCGFGLFDLEIDVDA